MENENKEQKTKKKFYKKWWFWVIVIIVLLMIIGSSDSSKNNEVIQQPVVEDTQSIKENSPTPVVEKEKTVPVNTQAITSTSVSSETISQKNAVKKAKSYLGYSAFSHDGLVAQLEFEQFSHNDAVYGADNSGANWNEQAAKKAKSYMEYSSFSRGGLITQLKYEKFTQEQAEYGASSVGL